MATVGYARVSSTGQSLEVQTEKLIAAGVEADHLFTEKRSGTTAKDRPELEAAMRSIRKGDVLLVTKMDRLARSVSDLRTIIDQLDAKGVGFRVLDQAAVDTTTPNGRLMLNMLAAFAEFETDLRKERQREGIERAKDRGVYKGRPVTLPRDQVIALRAEGLGATEIAKQLGMGRASVYRLLNEVATSQGLLGA
ncbi:recombinase family protein [Brevundimonas nasdae]|uniref:recombinase family protein n=1 Tax=Brevundimonas nasdae TaxID=172043 RepID=UPI003F68D53E